MLKRILALLAMLLSSALPVTAQDTCKTSITATAPDSRYSDNGNGTITDKITGLMWKQCSEGLSSVSAPCDTGTLTNYIWQDALQLAKTLNDNGGFAGYTDWRLPNFKELASLLEYQCYQPAINEHFFPNTSIYRYWSSTPSAGVDIRAWSVDFGNGYVFNGNRISNPMRVRLVRGGLK